MSSGDPETRKRILDKTWRLMEKRKGRDVKIDDVARAAGVSRQAVYLHFGSRAELLLSTARYIDEVNHLQERLQALYEAQNPLVLLENYVDFWGNYVPQIYGPAKALLIMRETDKAAAAAWNDRMQDAYQGLRHVMSCLARDELLAPEWDLNRAADAAWAMTSIPVWESLIFERNWSTGEYISYMKVSLKKMFVRDS